MMKTTCANRLRSLAGGLAMTAVCACSEPVVPICDYGLRPAVVVAVTDARSGNSLVEHAAGVVRDGTFSDSLGLCSIFGAGPARCGAYERIGTYDVDVQHVGYQPFSARGVLVSKGTCHVNTVTLKAALAPMP
jgi:hypothetical protein